MVNVYVIGGNNGYASWIQQDIRFVTNPKEADIAIFTGGADVTPILYRDHTDGSTYNVPERDLQEVGAYLELPKTLLKVGICRGAQLLTVLNGGKLIQDVSNHAGYPHDIITNEGEIYKITSCHHQMMMPYFLNPEEYQLLAWSHNRRSVHYTTGGTFQIEDPENFKEPEIVYYPGTKSLCIQGHPEMMSKEVAVNYYINKLVKKYINE